MYFLHLFFPLIDGKQAQVKQFSQGSTRIVAEPGPVPHPVFFSSRSVSKAQLRELACAKEVSGHVCPKDDSRGTGLPPAPSGGCPFLGISGRLRGLHHSGIENPRGQARARGQAGPCRHLRSFWPSPLWPGTPFPPPDGRRSAPTAVRSRGSQRRAPPCALAPKGKREVRGAWRWPPRPRRFAFLPGWGEKITQSCLFPQPGGAGPGK